MSSAEVPFSKGKRDDKACEEAAAVLHHAQCKHDPGEQAQREQALLNEKRRKRVMVQKAAKTRRNNMPEFVPFPFLRLPPELRNTIYGYVFEGKQYRFCRGIYSVEKPDRGILWRPEQSNGLGLLLASRQLHAETALLPYKLGIFQCDLVDPKDNEKACHSQAVRDFLQARSRKQISAIARLSVRTVKWCAEVLWERTQTGVDWATELGGR